MTPGRNQSALECAYAVAKAAERYLSSEKEDQYPNKKRDTGTGPTRIDTPLSVRADLYSKLFVSSFHAEYIHKYKSKIDRDDKIKEVALKQQEKIFKRGTLVVNLLQPSLSLNEEQFEEAVEDEQEDDSVPYDPTDKLDDSECEEEFGNENPSHLEAGDEEYDEEQVLEDSKKELEEIRVQLRQDRRSYASRMVAVWIFQVVFSMLILFEA